MMLEPNTDAVAVARRHLPAFVERIEQDGGALPKFVTDKLGALITCGDFEHGFLVAACRRCGEQLRVRYFGVFSNHHTLRPRIRVASSCSAPVVPMQVPLFDPAGLRPWASASSCATMPDPPGGSARIGWAKLLARAFAIDVAVCRRCGGQIRIVAAITDAIARMLHGARPPPRPSPAAQLSFSSR